MNLSTARSEKYSKEVGIRKTIGSQKKQMVFQFLSESILVSGFVAIPIVYYFMSRWLQNYEYRMQISWWIPGMAIIGALLIALITVSFQSIKAAMANPVKSLRME